MQINPEQLVKELSMVLGKENLSNIIKKINSIIAIKQAGVAQNNQSFTVSTIHL